MKNMQTVLLSEESKRKQLKLPVWVYHHLRDMAGDLPKPWSKGLVLYEYVMLVRDYHEDSFTRYESMVDEQLSDRVGRTDFPRELGKITKTTIDGSPPSEHLSQGSDEITDDLISLYLPAKLVESVSKTEVWGKRYWMGDLEDVVQEAVDYAFDSRYDRIECKRDLITYLDSGVAPDHEVAQAIVDGESDKYTGFERAHELITSTGDEWYNGDFDWSTFLNRASEISQKKRETRLRVLEKGLKAYEAKFPNRTFTPKVARKIAENAFAVSESTAKDYVEEIELPGSVDDVGDQDETSVWEVCNIAKKQIIDILDEGGYSKKKRRVERMSAPAVCLMKRDVVEEIDGADDAHKKRRLLQALIDSRAVRKHEVVQDQLHAHKHVKRVLREMLDEL